jgi:hypothetical protein
VEVRVEGYRLKIIEICGNKTQGAMRAFNAAWVFGEAFQSQESESEAKCDLLVLCLEGNQMVWTAWDILGCASR